MNDYAIGIDLGGTNVKVVAALESGGELERFDFSTADDARAGWAEAIRREIGAIEKRQKRKAAWVGISAPGHAGRDSRSIVCLPGRLRGLERFDWTAYLKDWEMVPVLNDAHAALLGEVWRGAARGCHHAALLTLGTGVGGAILADGRLLKGRSGRAGHLGHLCLDPEGVPDVTGMPGSIEWAIGNYSLPERSRGRFPSTQALVEAHLAGDAEATAVWLKSVKALACAIASIINVLDPEVVILGGGIAQAGPALLDPLHRWLDRFEWRPLGEKVRIIPAVLGEFAGALGAAYYAIHFFEQES
ncbi:MAG: ROK family protein [Planctomycetes bacterium]|nr:ROK family protein [Planctomycetota bacterium]